MSLRAIGLLVVTALLIFAAVPQVSHAAVYPSVTFSFDDPTDTYTYTIQTSANDTYPFGFFQVDMEVPFSYVATVEGPWANGDNQNWATFHGNRAPGFDYVSWQAAAGEQVTQGTVWTGLFKLIVPNTTPIPGNVYTKDGGDAFYEHHVMVPAVPEPGSLSVLLVGFSGIVGFWARRLKR
jgi:hypothetical protein